MLLEGAPDPERLSLPSLVYLRALSPSYLALARQAALLEGEVGGESGDGRDGPRRAAALSGVLRLLLLRKAEKLSGMLATDKLTAGPHSECSPTRGLDACTNAYLSGRSQQHI